MILSQFMIKSSLNHWLLTQVKHTKYNFVFKHDYITVDGEIQNYDKIMKRFQEKIQNWREWCRDEESTTIFINCCVDGNQLDIARMMSVLRNHKPHGSIYLFIYTCTPYYGDTHDNVTIILLTHQNRIYPWWQRDDAYEQIKKEYYTTFLHALRSNGITHHFPQLIP